jgi:hypothetical protein
MQALQALVDGGRESSEVLVVGRVSVVPKS